ncbi:stage II sporulation protein M [Rossellomorea sp. AcN35-11]|nr:stage II sporulation protein M [Rossellomorea aquimaris]WJV30835.1 stage II sporulation protein M [Rossellomorea sp. AcN35-11]
MQNRLKSIYGDTKLLLLISAIIFGLSLLFGGYLESRVEGAFLTENNHTSGDILKNNLKASVPLLLGFISLGVTTLGALLINGVAIGGSIIASTDYLTPFQIVCLIVPHGLLEIPALLLSSTVGFYSLKMLFVFLKGRRVDMKREFKTILYLLLIIIILFVSAAFVEANVTSHFYPE